MKTETIAGAPNLDAMNTHELMVFWAANHSVAPRRQAKLMFPDNPIGRVNALRALANYAANKATAMRCREVGNIETALYYESICDRIYKGLPEFAKW